MLYGQNYVDIRVFYFLCIFGVRLCFGLGPFVVLKRKLNATSDISGNSVLPDFVARVGEGSSLFPHDSRQKARSEMVF